MKRIHRLRTLVLACMSGLVATTAIYAVPTPYGNPGVVNPDTYTFTATGSGPVTAYFVGQTAGYGSDIGLSINGLAPVTFGLQNHAITSVYGASFNMGNVVAGDVLRFVLRVSTTNFNGPPPVTYELNSDASLNPGGEHYIYSYAYGGDPGQTPIPAGTYIGFEDISPLSDPSNDRDYDDHQFVFSGPGLASVPDSGSTLTLMGLATMGGAVLRRRLK